MARTQLNSKNIKSVQRNDMDIITTGEAVITKLIAGANVSLSQTGIDVGTGDVTINSTTPNIYQVLTAGNQAETKDIKFRSIYDIPNNLGTTSALDYYGLSVSDSYTIAGNIRKDISTGYYPDGMLSNTQIAGQAINVAFIGFDENSRGSFNAPRDVDNTKRFIPIKVNGVYADSTGNIIIPSGGITSMTIIGSTPNATAATISGTTLTLQPASTSFGGIITTGTQSFAGIKTFTNSITCVSPGASGYFKMLGNARHGFIQTAYSNVLFSNNVYFDGSQYRYEQAGKAATVQTESSNGGINLTLYDLAGGAAGALATPRTILSVQQSGTVTIGPDYSPAPSVLLMLTATDKGFLKPRLTTTQRSNMPGLVAGLEVYDSTLNKPYYFNGTDWVDNSCGAITSDPNTEVIETYTDSSTPLVIKTFTFQPATITRVEIKAIALNYSVGGFSGEKTFTYYNDGNGTGTLGASYSLFKDEIYGSLPFIEFSIDNINGGQVTLSLIGSSNLGEELNWKVIIKKIVKELPL